VRQVTANPAKGDPVTVPQRSGAQRCRGHAVTFSDGLALICLTMNEIRRMHALLCRPAHPLEHHSAGRPGGAATRPVHGTATTSDDASAATNRGPY
jgi:hypothetical protein